MDLQFRVDALQADGNWFGVVRLGQVEIFRGPEADTRGTAYTSVKVAFAERLRDLLAVPAGHLQEVLALRPAT